MIRMSVVRGVRDGLLGGVLIRLAVEERLLVMDA